MKVFFTFLPRCGTDSEVLDVILLYSLFTFIALTLFQLLNFNKQVHVVYVFLGV